MSTATITPQLVKDLREKTGAGMADCKKALEESGGELQGAIEYLRKKGAATVAKRSDRSANEGLVVTKTTPDGMTAVIAEVNCETDFVARNEEFVAFVDQLAQSLLNARQHDMENIWDINAGTGTLKDMHNDILAKFSEKIELRRHERMQTDGFIADYIHTGNRLGVLVEIDAPNPNDKVRTYMRDIAMQIAAMNPMFANREQVTEAIIEKEKEIYRQQAEQEGKKPEIAERVAAGRLEKFYQENCLVEQSFVKDSTKTVNEVLQDISKEMGREVKIRGFKRFMLGESTGE
ncbi:MAG: translation elongation factor Ts [Bacteroidota bacterium]